MKTHLLAIESGRLFCCLSLCLSLLACGDYSNEELASDLAFLQAIPDRAVLAVRVADASPRSGAVTESTAGLALHRDALLGETAIYYLY